MRTRSNCFKMRIFQKKKKKMVCLLLTCEPLCSLFASTCWLWLSLEGNIFSQARICTWCSFTCVPTEVMTSILSFLQPKQCVLDLIHCDIVPSVSRVSSWGPSDWVYPSSQYRETRLQEIPGVHEHTTLIQQRDYGLYFCTSRCHTHTDTHSRLWHVCSRGIPSSWDHGWFGFR